MNIFRDGSSSPEGVLKIDETKSKHKIRARKRKRIVRSASSSECDESLPENCLAMEEKVCTSAAKNNLTTQNVKNILKKVVTNEHVLALVKLQEEEEDSEAEIIEKPKLPVTRAKAKQLNRASTPTAPWNLPLTPIKAIHVKTTPEVSALVSQEHPDEESDDEYHPTDEAMSDDDRDTIQSSDLDSQPQTPNAPRAQSRIQITQDETKYTDDGVFKIPSDLCKTPSKLDAINDIEEEATIARRTRSKLCLSETSIETIEKSFVPPDVPDDPVIDNVWTDFITEIMNPAPASHEEDDEADPEYNYAADQDISDDDDVFDDKLAKISKKELSDLVAELFEDIGDMLNEEEENSDLKQLRENGSYVLTDISNNKPQTDIKEVSKTVPEDLNVSEVELIEMKKLRQDEAIDESKEVEIIEMKKSKQDEAIDESKVKIIEMKKLRQDEVIDLSEEVEASISNKKMEITSVELQDGKDKEQVQANASNTIPEAVPSNLVKPVPDKDNFLNINMANYAIFFTPLLKPAPKLPVGCNCARKIDEVNKKHVGTMNGERVQVVYAVPRADVGSIMLPEQYTILAQQMRMHVQIVTQCFLQTYANPQLWMMAPKEKEFLINLNNLAGNRENSYFRPLNLESSLELCAGWERRLEEDTEDNRELMKFTTTEAEKSRKRRKNGCLYAQMFPRQLMNLMSNAPGVIIYPHLLPAQPFRVDLKPMGKRRRNRSENHLVAIGMEEFKWFMHINQHIFKKRIKHILYVRTILQLIGKYMLPYVDHKGLNHYVTLVKLKQSDDNPIKFFFSNMKAPPTKHTIIPFHMTRSLRDYAPQTLPLIWYHHLNPKLNKMEATFLKKTSQWGVSPEGEIISVAIPSKVRPSKIITKKILLPLAEKIKPAPNTTVNVPISNLASCDAIVENNISVNYSTESTNLGQFVGTLIPVIIRESHSEAATVPLINETAPVCRSTTVFSSTDANCVNSYNAPIVSVQVSNYPKVESSHDINNTVLNNPLVLGTSGSVYLNNGSYNVNQNIQTENGHIIVSSILKEPPPPQKDPAHHLYVNELLHLISSLNHSSECSCKCLLERCKSNLQVLRGQKFITNYFQPRSLVKLHTEFTVESDNQSTTTTINVVTDSDCDVEDIKDIKLTSNIAQLSCTNQLLKLLELSSNNGTTRIIQSNTQAYDIWGYLKYRLFLLQKMLPSMPVLYRQDSQDKAAPGLAHTQPFTAPPNTLNTEKTKGPTVKRNVDWKNIDYRQKPDDLNEMNFVTSYFVKVQSRLNSHNDINTTPCDSPKFIEFQNILDSFNPETESPVELYRNIEKFFGLENADLTEEFLLFLTPGQAVEVERFLDHFLLTRMSEFINRLEVIFARKPATLRKIIKAMQDALDGGPVRVSDIRSTVLPYLRSHPELTDYFLSLLPDERPSDSMAVSNREIFPEEMWSSDDGSEKWEVPNIDENPDVKYSDGNDIMYINGRVFVKNKRVLRAAHVSFPDSSFAWSEHAGRLALPVAVGNTHMESDDERASPKRNIKHLRVRSARKLCMSSKKQCKRNDSQQPKSLELSSAREETPSSALLTPSAPVVSTAEPITTEPLEANRTIGGVRKKEPAIMDFEDSIQSFKVTGNTEAEKDSALHIKEEPVDGGVENQESKSEWTRDEDKIILEVLRCESSSQQTFGRIRSLLPHRSSDDIKHRFQNVMNLLQQMACNT